MNSCPRSARSSRIFVAALVCGLLATWTARAEEAVGYAVIVHPSNPSPPLAAAEVSDFFLGKRRSWRHGGLVDAVDRTTGSAVRETFSRAIHGRSAQSIRSFWQRKIFSGAGTPPIELGSDQAVVQHVLANPGAIGYVLPSAELAGARWLPTPAVPRSTHFVPARYTEAAMKAKVEGTVTVLLSVDVEGKVRKVEVVAGLPHGLTQEVLRKARSWRYEPVAWLGEPLELSFEVDVEFHF